MWEDQGTNIIDTLTNAEQHTQTLGDNQKDLNDSVSEMDNDPAVKMQKAFADMQTSLTPLLTKVAEFIGKIADWVSENPRLAATITTIATVLGILMGVFAALTPILFAFSGGMIAAMLPILAVVAGISALIAIGVLLWKNWDSIASFVKTIWGGIKDFLLACWEGIKSAVIFVWNGIKAYYITWFNILKTIFTTAWNIIKTIVSTVINVIKTVIVTVWNSIKTTITTILNGIKVVITTVWNAIKSVTTSVFNGIKSVASSVWDGIKSTISTVVNGVKNAVTNAWNTIKSNTVTTWNAVKDAITKPIKAAKKVVDDIIDKIKEKLSSLNPGKLIGGTVDKITGLFGGKKMAVAPGGERPEGMTDGDYLNTPQLLGFRQSRTDLGSALSNLQASTVSAMSRVRSANRAAMQAQAPFDTNSFFKGLTNVLQATSSSSPITLQINLDGYEIAKATYKHTTTLQEKDAARNRRFGGI